MADVALGARELDEVAGAGMTAFLAVEDPPLELLFGVEIAHEFPFREGDRGVVGTTYSPALAYWMVPPVPAFISTISCSGGSGNVVMDFDGSNKSPRADKEHGLSPRNVVGAGRLDTLAIKRHNCGHVNPVAPRCSRPPLRGH